MSSQASLTRQDTSGVVTGRMGMWWFLASEVAVFGGLLACYILFRFRHPEWAEPASQTLMWIGTLNTVILLTSSLTMVLAGDAAAQGKFGPARTFLTITIVLGLVFLGVKGFEYHHEITHGRVPAVSLFWSFYFLMTGLHGLHVLGGVVANAVVCLGIKKYPLRVDHAGLYWHFVDVVWIILFPLLYVSS